LGEEASSFSVKAEAARRDWTRVVFRLRVGEIPYAPALRLPLPLPATKGVIVDGKMPFWLLAGVVRFYAALGKQVAVFQARIEKDVPVT
jgi:hypothetical protein